MYDLKNICFICLTDSDRNVKIVLHNDTEDEIFTHVKYALPELAFLDSEVPVYICSSCGITLRGFYTFKKKCLENYSRWKHYIQIRVLQESSNTQAQSFNDLQTRINCAPPIIQEQELDTEVNIKEENEDTLPLSSGTEEQIFKDFEMKIDDNIPSIKEEPEVHIFSNVVVEMNEDDDLSPEEKNDQNTVVQDNNENSSLHTYCGNGWFTDDLLPKKSKERYESAYLKFINWCKIRNITYYSESVLLGYFQEFPHKKSMWSTYSMLKSCLLIHNNIDIQRYSKLLFFLKYETAKNQKPKKPRVLNDSHINQFINEAPDHTFLLMKAILIIGVSGACRREELCRMLINHLEFKTDIVIVAIPDNKTVSRSFVIIQSDWINLLKKYIDIRAKVLPKDNRLFYTYRNGQCVNVPYGLNTIGKVPSRIATYLKLDKPNEFTGHCFRRTSATIQQGYIDESRQNRQAIARKLTESYAGTSNETAAINYRVPPALLTQSIQRNEDDPEIIISGS